MEYKGKLYGRVGQGYIPLESTTEDFEALKRQVTSLTEEVERLKAVVRAADDVIDAHRQRNIDCNMLTDRTLFNTLSHYNTLKRG